MAKHHHHDDIRVSRPLPTTTIPWLVIIALVAGLVLVYLGFLRPPEQLLGSPLPKNEYLHYLTPRKSAPKPTPAAPSAAPAVTTPAAPTPPPAPSPATTEHDRVIGE